ncbi:MAG TPA: nickel-dependent lactate racemase [Bryobacteraceae bacterium]|nr:nickel-dependent lactate racemase [Bryobacteraceae bacterium]
MEIRLAFGRDGINVALPQGFRYQILEARSAEPLADWQGALEAALDRPIGTAPLREIAQGKRSAAISVCDITRPAPNRKTLPPVLQRLEQAGIPRDQITILIATGLHRPASQEEIREICGEEIAGCYRVVNHDARNLSSHRHLGSTSSGTSVHIDERFIAADLHLTLGFIEPHLMLGFSGGRKLVAPGLAAEQTIKVLHSPPFMRDPRAVEGSIEDNPLHRELLEIARMARHDFILDVALARDRSIAGVFAGHPEKAHQRGVEFVSHALLQTLDEPVDAVITTSAGYPLDLTFYQAIKGVTAASHIVKPGGHTLLFAACEEGVGAPEFRRMLLDSGTDSDFLRQIEGGPATIDQWQLEKLALTTRKQRVSWYVPGVPAEYQGKLWGPAYANAQSAIDELIAALPADATVAVIPDGPYVLAKAAEFETSAR